MQLEDEVLILDHVKMVEKNKMNGIGTMIKLKNNSTTIYLVVSRLYINVGSGFAISNTRATKKVLTILEKLL